MTQNEIYIGDCPEVMRAWPDGSVDMCVTSPPYWGQRDYHAEGQYGSERTIEEYIAKQVEVFQEVRRVLKPWGTLWLNMGDSYNSEAGNYRGIVQGIKGEAGSTLSGGMKILANKAYRYKGKRKPQKGFKPKDLFGQPWRLAFALQQDGWWLRSDIIWAKAVSFCETYSGSTMPESVNGWRWERCRVKVKAGGVENKKRRGATPYDGIQSGCAGDHPERLAQWQPCPGCKKCEEHGGYVLRKGSWRPTKAHEYLFLLAKSPDYYCDAEAVKENCGDNTHDKGTALSPLREGQVGHKDWTSYVPAANMARRNLRDVWAINPAPTTWEYCAACDTLYGAGEYKRLKTAKIIVDGKERKVRVCWCGRKDAWVQHFATFPAALVEPCIKAGTSEKGNCPTCGMPAVRVVEQTQTIASSHKGSRFDKGRTGIRDGGERTQEGERFEATTTGWLPSCDCGVPIEQNVPAIVLDPYMGSGTTALVAYALGRDYVGIELNPQYAAMAKARLRAEAEQFGLWER